MKYIFALNFSQCKKTDVVYSVSFACGLVKLIFGNLVLMVSVFFLLPHLTTSSVPDCSLIPLPLTMCVNLIPVHVIVFRISLPFMFINAPSTRKISFVVLFCDLPSVCFILHTCFGPFDTNNNFGFICVSLHIESFFCYSQFV